MAWTKRRLPWTGMSPGSSCLSLPTSSTTSPRRMFELAQVASASVELEILDVPRPRGLHHPVQRQVLGHDDPSHPAASFVRSVRLHADMRTHFRDRPSASAATAAGEFSWRDRGRRQARCAATRFGLTRPAASVRQARPAAMTAAAATPARIDAVAARPSTEPSTPAIG